MKPTKMESVGSKTLFLIYYKLLDKFYGQTQLVKYSR
jgi:hypothetical protein